MGTQGGSLPYAWVPTDRAARSSRVMQLARTLGIDSYPVLVSRSQQDPGWFWEAAVVDLGIEFHHPYRAVVEESHGIEWAQWFVDGTINVAWNCVGRWAESDPDAVAVIGDHESGLGERLTFGELWARVRSFAAGLAALGVRAGDRVGLHLPMTVEAVVASHACALIGAVQVPLFSGLAAPAIRERLLDADVCAVVTAVRTMRKGWEVPMAAVLIDALGPDLQVPVVVWSVGQESLPADPRVHPWAQLTTHDADDVRVEPFDSEHPYLLAYTSGTTGRPKGVVHASAGFLVKIAAEAAYQTDIGSQDRLVWFTDLGWLMGIWSIVGAHANGAAVVMSDGMPTTPTDRVWRLCREAQVTVLGLSPSLARALAAGPGSGGEDAGSLRILASTGEPWDLPTYEWFHETFGLRRLPIINFSGGTEVGACFFSCTPAHPIKALSVGLPSLGMAVDVVDPDGETVEGRIGELVCRKSWPGMTRGVWRDRDRYLSSYWARFPGAWTHGDLVHRDEDGHWFVTGRSDDTLNVAGKRIGPGELESVITRHPAVLEAAVVAVPDRAKGQTPWAFCVIAPTATPSPDTLQLDLGELIRREVGAAFLPTRFLFVEALPKTLSNKTARRVLRSVAAGAEPGDLSGLQDLAVLERLRQLVGGTE